jgi:hypothetical protein
MLKIAEHSQSQGEVTGTGIREINVEKCGLGEV